MAQISWPVCPPKTVQLRPAQREHFSGVRYSDILWRQAVCNPGRWHWYDNPCTCDLGVTLIHTLTYGCGYAQEWPEAITGTWNRDWSGIAHRTRNARQQIAEQRAHEAAVAKAIGPRKLVTFNVDFETRYNALINESIDRMIREGLWSGPRKWSHL